MARRRSPDAGSGGGRSGRRGTTRRQQIVGIAVSDLRNALISKGFGADAALRFARMALTQKGVEIGGKGRIHYRGKIFNAADFANSHVAQYVTGELAKKQNEATLKADPNYQMALAQLGLTRDQSQAALDMQRRQSLLDFGDPTLVQGDPSLATAAGANPFSTARLMELAHQRDVEAVTNQTNRAGTLFGGGFQSGQKEATRVFAGNQTNATSALQQLLASLSQQGANLSQNYNLGQQSALLQTQQNLMAQGLLKAATAPKYAVGQFKLFRLPRGRRGGMRGVHATPTGGYGPGSPPQPPSQYPTNPAPVGQPIIPGAPAPPPPLYPPPPPPLRAYG